MRRTSVNGSAWALALALAGLTACGGNPQTTGMATEEDTTAAERYAEFTGAGTGTDRADCVAAGGTTMEGMPATQHQAQVLDDDIAGAVATEPAAGCPETGEMPSTMHQEEVLDEDAADEGGSSY